MYPTPIQKLIDLFSKFPTIGPRTAARFVFYILKLNKEKTKEIASAISELKEKVSLCNFCFNPYEIKNQENLCPICSQKTRDKSLLCVVEKESDLESIERTKRYKGLYFILDGTISSFKKSNFEKIRIRELKERIRDPKKFGIETNFKEIIIATNPTTEGEATALYLERELKPFNKKMTRLGRGLPLGGELEYTDPETLSSAIEGRK
jgi:recombination protein RecR